MELITQQSFQCTYELPKNQNYYKLSCIIIIMIMEMHNNNENNYSISLKQIKGWEDTLLCNNEHLRITWCMLSQLYEQYISI